MPVPDGLMPCIVSALWRVTVMLILFGRNIGNKWLSSGYSGENRGIYPEHIT